MKHVKKYEDEWVYIVCVFANRFMKPEIIYIEIGNVE